MSSTLRGSVKKRFTEIAEKYERKGYYPAASTLKARNVLKDEVSSEIMRVFSEEQRKIFDRKGGV